MAFWDWLFAKWRRHNDSYRLGLCLKYPPIPNNASHLAQIVVEATRSVDGTELDYTPGSLVNVDRIVGRFHERGLRPDQMGETVFSFGCYVGEVLVRNNQGAWRMPADTNLPRDLKNETNIMVVELPNGVVCNPIGKAFKLLENGDGESLSFFYQVMTNQSTSA